MALPKTFAVGELLTAEDVNEHLVNRQRIEAGKVSISYGGQSSAWQDVVFSRPFTQPPNVLVSYEGAQISPRTIAHTSDISATGFRARIMTADGTTHTGTRIVSWLAVETYSPDED